MSDICYYIAFEKSIFNYDFSTELIAILKNGDGNIMFEPFPYYPTNVDHKDVIYVCTEEESLKKIPEGSIVVMINMFVESDKYRIFHFVTGDHHKGLPIWLSSIISIDINRLAVIIKKNYQEQQKVESQIDELQAKLDV